MLGEVYVQHESATHLLERAEAGGVGGLVELSDDISKLRVQLQELLEGAVSQGEKTDRQTDRQAITHQLHTNYTPITGANGRGLSN